MNRVTWGRMQNPVRGFLHGGAAIASVIGLIVLLAVNPLRLSVVAASSIYAGSLVIMYTISALYHSVPWSDRWKERMRRLDHSGIFLVVAGTYTPIAVIALDGVWETATLAAVWVAALVGIVIKLVERRVRLGISVTIQSVMGWGALIPMWEIARQLGTDTVLWVAAGGLLYTVGMVFMLTRWPKLSPRVFGYHELFHVLVVAASAVHFVAILTRVIPQAV